MEKSIGSLYQEEHHHLQLLAKQESEIRDLLWKKREVETVLDIDLPHMEDSVLSGAYKSIMEDARVLQEQILDTKKHIENVREAIERFYAGAQAKLRASRGETKNEIGAHYLQGLEQAEIDRKAQAAAARAAEAGRAVCKYQRARCLGAKAVAEFLVACNKPQFEAVMKAAA